MRFILEAYGDAGIEANSKWQRTLIEQFQTPRTWPKFTSQSRLSGKYSVTKGEGSASLELYIREEIMKFPKYPLTLVALVALLGLAAPISKAQNQNPNPNPNRPGRGNFDPEQFRQRMFDRIREQMDVKDDAEWKLISDRITKVFDARREVGFGGGPMGFRPPRTADQGGDNARRPRGFGGEPSPEAEALQKALDAKAPADEIKGKLAKLRDARKDKRAKLEQAQDDLRKVLTVRQEAVAVMNGLLD